MKIPHTSTADEQIDILADVLQNEFGGPTQNESAVEMAIRMLRTGANVPLHRQEKMMMSTMIAQGRMAMYPQYDKPMTDMQINTVVHDSVKIANALHAKISEQR